MTKVSKELIEEMAKVVMKIDFNDPAIKRSIEGVRKAIEMHKDNLRKTGQLKELEKIEANERRTQELLKSKKRKKSPLEL